MKKATKRLLAVVLLSACLAGAAAIICVVFFRPPPPPVMGVEGLIPEGPDTLIITRDMAVFWDSMEEDAAAVDTRFLSLLKAGASNLGPARGDITDIFSPEDISPELLFYLLGYESAFAVYPSDDDPRLLFVSRVHPTVVFLEQFIIFIDEETHIDRVPRGNLTVREVTTEGDRGPTLFYTFDNDLLVSSNDRRLFEASLDLLTGDETASIADEPIRRELGRFRADDACAWGFFRGGLPEDDTTDSILLHVLGGERISGSSPVFFSGTWEEQSLCVTAAWKAGGDAPRPPAPSPRPRYAERQLLSLWVTGDLLPAEDGTTVPLSRLFPSGCRGELTSEESSGAVHPAIWGAAGPDADSIARGALENSGAPVSRYLVDDVTITSGVLNGEGIMYTACDGLIIIGTNETDILAQRRFIQNSTADQSPPPGVIASAHLKPSALIEAPDARDVLAPLLCACGFSAAGGEGGEALSYRELTDALSAWETADAVVWAGDGQTNLAIILSRKEVQP